MSLSRLEQLRLQNTKLKQQITQLKSHNSTGHLQGEINRFIEESKNNLNEMNKKIVQQNAKQNALLHTATANYEGVLRRQIQLLNQNKQLSQQKEQQDQVFNQEVEKLTVEYQSRIKSFQSKVKANVKKIQDLSNGGNMIARLISNPRFRQVMQERGCSLQALENQSKLQEVSQQVEEREKEIQQAEEKSARLDQQLMKMHELIDTMKNLLQNMMKEKENILKQNVVLKEKLKQSEVLIAKLLGENMPEEDGEDEEGEQEEGEEEEEQQAETGQAQQEGN